MTNTESLFEYKGKRYKAVKQRQGCYGCAFEHADCSATGVKEMPSCIELDRKDRRDVIFVEIASFKSK